MFTSDCILEKQNLYIFKKYEYLCELFCLQYINILNVFVAPFSGTKEVPLLQPLKQKQKKIGSLHRNLNAWEQRKCLNRY